MALSYCKALYSSSKMAWLMYFVGFLYLVISTFILIEKWSLPCSQTSRLLQDRLCANQSGVSQFYSIFTDTDLRQLPFYHLPFLFVLGKLLSPSSGLTLLEKVLTSHAFVHELPFLLQVPKIILLATHEPQIHVVIR